MRNNNIYISDLLSVHTPRKATSQQEYLRQMACRRLLWALLPYLGQALLGILACGILFFGVMALSLGMGG